MKNLLRSYTIRLASLAWLLVIFLVFNYIVSLHFLFERSFELGPIVIGIPLISSYTWAFLFVMFLALWPGSRIRVFLSTFLIIIAITLFVVDNYLLSAYSYVYTDSMAISLFATNIAETKEFISGSIVSWWLIPLVFSFVLIAITFRYRKSIESAVSFLFERYRNLTTAVLISPLLLLFFILLQIHTHFYLGGYNGFRFSTSFPRFVTNTMICLEEQRKVQEHINDVKNGDLGHFFVEKKLEPFNLVIVIGESLRRDYMHCYGYPISNTPNLDTLIQNKEMVLYTDVIAPVSYTIGSLSKSLTFSDNYSDKEWYQFVSLPATLSRAGYFTYWVSNQELQGGNIQPVATIAATSDSTKYTRARSATLWDSSYDETVLPFLMTKDGIETHSPKRSIAQFVHLMGSHTTYRERFPKDFARFSASDLPEMTPQGHTRPKSQEKDQVLVDYINSIYYNDHIISEIVGKYKHQPTILIYFADHGVEVYDNPKKPDFSGHPNSIDGLRVPLLVYFSPSMRNSYPDFWEEVTKSANNKIMTDLFTRSVCGMLGIRTKYSDEKLNFFSPKYDNTRKRVSEVFGTMMETL